MNEKEILVFGYSGQVSTALREVLENARYVSRLECDFERPSDIHSILDSMRPRVVVNLVAYTAVDKAESDRQSAFAINGEAPREIAAWCKSNYCSLVHVSTDYVYSGNGEKAWLENDIADPINVYGESKLAGEVAVKSSDCHHIILRTSWVYSRTGNNFFKTMVRLGGEREELRIVDDQIGAPTYALDLARAIRQIVEHRDFLALNGIYNLANGGVTSWYGFAVEIFKLLKAAGKDLKVKNVIPVKSSEYTTPAKRPLNSRLSLEKISTDFQIGLRSWTSALEDCARKA
ncbi:MAG: dTDP-4-dehydrorhamnose reductase [Bdellovibrionales bacterium]|nr:dTDP-4-dehydrorhamnose reductase [Bdellovibrionales bacterium]